MLAQPVKTIPAFHGTRVLLTVFPIPRQYTEPDESRSSIALCKTPFNINLSSTPRSPTWSLLFGFPTKISRLPCACCMSCSLPPPRFDHGARVHTCKCKTLYTFVAWLILVYRCPNFAHLCSYTNGIRIQLLLELPQVNFHYNETEKHRSVLYSSTFSSITMVEFIFRVHHNE